MSAAPAPAPELAAAKAELRGALRHVADFPQPGIDFVDIMPLFAQPALHARLLDALARQVALTWGAAAAGPEALVGLDARGFLFGPGLALRLGLPFVAVRKKGKLPGPCVAAEYVKEYGVDVFEMQSGALRPRQRVLVVDDIIATGGSAKAAADLVAQLDAQLIGYLFILAIPGLHGPEKLAPAPVAVLLDGE